MRENCSKSDQRKKKSVSKTEGLPKKEKQTRILSHVPSYHINAQISLTMKRWKKQTNNIEAYTGGKCIYECILSHIPISILDNCILVDFHFIQKEKMGNHNI